MPQACALLFGALSLVVAAFQVALVLGAPWGEYTLGGRWSGALPVAVRVLPGLSAVLLLFFAVVVAARAGVAFPSIAEFAFTGVWAVVAYCALGSIANAFTPSRRERMIWLPVVLGMLVLSLVVALS
jgi:uncharacterized membrane protein SirB2